MNKSWLIILSLLGLAFTGVFDHASAQNARGFTNPILAGFYPDPSICRVGSNYYLVASSFSYFPGIPIFHSKDLANWKQIGHVMDRAEQLDLDGLGVSRGIFAPAIRYNDGVFYVTCTLVDKGGNFVVTSKKPEGPWSNPVWMPQINGIDPSMFFDENSKAYIIYNSVAPDDKPLYEGHRTLRMYEFDVAHLKVIGEERILVNGGTDLSKKPIWIEAPHIFQEDDYYYLIAAEGGTADQHSEVVFRSTKNDWPVIDPDHEEVQYHYPFPIQPSQERVDIPHRENFQFRDEFVAEALNHNWVFLRTPRKKWYDLKSRKGFLAMRLRPESCAGNLNPSFLGHRQQHLHGSAIVAIDFLPKAENEKAGLLIFQNETHFYFLCKSLDGNAAAIQLYKSGKQQMELLASQALKAEQTAKSFYLKIEARGDTYSFSFATNPDKWILLQDNVDARFLSTGVAGGFVGCVYALYATSLGRPSQSAAYFDWFEYRGDDEVYHERE